MTQSDPAVDLEDLRFAWAPDRPPVLDIASLRIARGERVFIYGPSGSGKTTLLSVIGGVLMPQRGHVQVLGRDLAELGGSARDRFRAAHIGFVFQLFNLIPYLSVMENVQLPCRFSPPRRDRAVSGGNDLDAEATRLLTHLGLAGREMADRPVTELSVGQQQRVAAARALIGAPELIIADEPTSALDTDLREDFLALLMRECEQSGITLLFVSHDRSLQGLFDRAIGLDDINAGISAAVA